MILAAGSTPGILVSYGPILVATGGIMMAIIAAYGRKDKKVTDQSENLDKKTNTVLKGLELSLERTETERAYWEARAIAAEKKEAALEEQHETCEAEIESLRKQLRQRRARKQP